MSIIRKKFITLSVLIGGLLFMATVRPTHAFALSDSSSGTETPPTTNTATQDPATDSPDTTTSPTDPTNSAIAGGSTATQNDTSAIDSTSSDSDATTPTDTNNSQPTDTSTTGTTNPSNTGQSDTTGQNNTTVNTTVNGTAQSGDASVSDSPKGGDATTGGASDTATIINSDTSSTDSSGNGVQTFTYNINGDQNNDILLNLASILAASNNATPASTGSTTENQNNTTVDNDVSLSATSGDATVSGNGVGGDATTGDALTEADIMNLLTSLICDNQSFIGTININGNLNGNILIPESLIDSLLNPSSTTGGTTGSSTAANNISINNDVSLSAMSGTASEINNGQSGNATSGNATTTLNMYNLINSNIVGGNVLLVFVNVVGTWYGLLLNAPAGSTTAALGGGISQDSVMPATDSTATNMITINNILNLCSTTGNATVSDNGIGGNATTGNATAIADITNIVDSQINLTGWLGVLIINVFGSWNGSLLTQASTVPLVSVHQTAKKAQVSSAIAALTDDYGDLNDLFLVTSANSGNTPIVTAAAHQVLGDSISGSSADLALPAKTVASSVHKAKSYKNLIISLIVVVAAALVMVAATQRISAQSKKS